MTRRDRSTIIVLLVIGGLLGASLGWLSATAFDADNPAGGLGVLSVW
jgi:hypothetical protein